MARRRARDYLTALAVLIAVGAAVAIVSRLPDRRIVGSVHVVDGDSLTLAGKRLRLEGIDAPELGQICRNGGSQASCGRQARAHLRRLVGGAPVQCDGWRTDRYDRLLVVCSARGVELNAAMVRDGWALAYGGYEAEEGEARIARRGLWALEFEQPADWRREHPRDHEVPSPIPGIRQSAMRALTLLADWLTSWMR